MRWPSRRRATSSRRAPFRAPPTDDLPDPPEADEDRPEAAEPGDEPPDPSQLPRPPVRLMPSDEALTPHRPLDAPPAPDEDASDEGTRAAPATDDPPAAAPASSAPPASTEPADGPVDEDEARARTLAAHEIVRRALDEDLDVAGDVTSETTVPPQATGTARLVAREEGVVAGLGLVALVYDHLDPRVAVRVRAADGDAIVPGQVLAEVDGPLRSVLTGERAALNLVGHLSGVATLTARYVAAVASTGCRVRDTRKTTPGLRLLEKAAVRAGGGVGHRRGLSDALLVKDNHVAAAGGVALATRAALAGARDRPVQVEVDSLAQLREAVAAGARDVLLDNFDPAGAREAVAWLRSVEEVHGRVAVEASGGVDLGTVRALAEAGVDRVAVGALTHSAPRLDLGLDVAAGDVPTPPA